MNDHKDGEKMILSHDPVPGYRLIFYIVCSVAVLYLGSIFLRSVM